MDTITLDPEEEVRICFKDDPITLFWCRIVRKVQYWELISYCEVRFLLQDVDLVHCRIGKIEGLEVLQKAKVSILPDSQRVGQVPSLTAVTEQQSC